MLDLRSPWLGAAAATAFFAVTAGPLMLAAGWTAVWGCASFIEGLGFIANGWCASHGTFLVWFGSALAAPIAIWATVRVCIGALAAERSML